MHVNHRRKNPIAKDLRTPKYKMRVVGLKTLYKRKPKHPNDLTVESGTV